MSAKSTKSKSVRAGVRRVKATSPVTAPIARKVTREMTQAEVKDRIKGLLAKDAKPVICALVGHSRIQTYCFGYFNCSRCDAQVGDSLASSYPQAKEVVVVGHDCAQCRTNEKTLTWRDRWMAAEPFPKAEAAHA